MIAHIIINTTNKQTELKYSKELKEYELNTDDLEKAKRRAMRLAKKTTATLRHIKGRPKWKYPRPMGNHRKDKKKEWGTLAMRVYSNQDKHFRYTVVIQIEKRHPDSIVQRLIDNGTIPKWT